MKKSPHYLKSIELRQQGHSVKDIAKILGAAQGSVSTWVRDIVLTDEQKLKLKQKGHSPEVIERRRQSRLTRSEAERNVLINKAAAAIQKLDKNSLLFLGLGLYWGEGAKTKKVGISNSDPLLVKMCMKFLREVCQIPEDKFRAHIHLHSINAQKDAEIYWSNITNIPLSQFYKTYTIKSKSSKNIRNTLPYGTVDVTVNDVKILLQILGWIEGLKRQL